MWLPTTREDRMRVAFKLRSVWTDIERGECPVRLTSEGFNNSDGYFENITFRVWMTVKGTNVRLKFFTGFIPKNV